MAIVNLGILAHVDAGKTTLTERILFTTGVIASAGSVDQGTTQTDTLELERARGITIRAAVVSFQLHALKVNLIDTPGHADFIAEVARSLRVLDAVVLVVSAVEGVQPQTRRLARAIRAAGLPLLIFVNKIDCLGAQGEAILADLRRQLGLRVVALNASAELGSRAATVIAHDRARPEWRGPLSDVLAETNARVIAEFERTDGAPSADYLEAELRAQVAAGVVAPVYFGSAVTGAGVPDLLAGIETWLPRAAEAADAPLAGTIFKVARQPSGEKLAYARLFAGKLAVRQPALLRRRDARGETTQTAERITGIGHFSAGTVRAAEAVSAGGIAVLHGLRSARIGDQLGAAEHAAPELPEAFPAPALESVVRPVRPGDLPRLRAALEALAEQDPLIALRQRDAAGEIAIRLYGEVQKEVVGDMLARDFRVSALFGPSQIICIERPVGIGEHVEIMGEGGNPFAATVGLRVEPAQPGDGVRYQRELGALPLAFYRAIEETVYDTLKQGLSGWELPDCTVTLTQVGMCPISTAADFRKLTPLVLMRALRQAGTAVCEPVEELEIEVPEDTYGTVCATLGRARGIIRDTVLTGGVRRLVCALPTAELRAVEQQLPRLTRGDGSWLSSFAGYVPIAGAPPVRARVGPNPLDRAQYLAELARA